MRRTLKVTVAAVLWLAMAATTAAAAHASSGGAGAELGAVVITFAALGLVGYLARMGVKVVRRR